MICTHQQILMGDQFEKNKISGACSTYGEKEWCIKGFSWGNQRESEHLENPGVDGRIILKCT